jgi:hypothetical protein
MLETNPDLCADVDVGNSLAALRSERLVTMALEGELGEEIVCDGMLHRGQRGSLLVIVCRRQPFGLSRRRRFWLSRSLSRQGATSNCAGSPYLKPFSAGATTSLTLSTRQPVLARPLTAR